jgi:SAM-dependent methyltransferase
MKEKTHETIRNAYATVASGGGNCCGAGAPGTTCSPSPAGYTEKEFSQAPAEADLGLGCGNPTAIASLRRGETVLDLGSGAGFDCLLASRQVGETGRVIGVDLTPEMIEKARGVARRAGAHNVEYRLGEIEHLPVDNASIDVVISNCVINLVPDKGRAFREAFRVLRSGGRLAISDTALRQALPDAVKSSLNEHVACLAGAIPVRQYDALLHAAGFTSVLVTIKSTSNCIAPDTKDPIGQAIVKEFGSMIRLNDFIASVYIEAIKP